MDSRSKPYYFAFDTKSKPGFVIAHSVRFESQEFPKELFEDTEFTILGADAEEDPRVRNLAKVVRGGKW